MIAAERLNRAFELPFNRCYMGLSRYAKAEHHPFEINLMRHIETNNLVRDETSDKPRTEFWQVHALLIYHPLI